jgi:hypothetical protein
LKKALPKLIFVLFSMNLLTLGTNILLVKSEENLLLSIDVDRTVMQVGQKINIMLTLKNVGESNVTICYTPPLFDVCYCGSDGCFCWSDGLYFIQVFLCFTLEPGRNCSETLQWNLYQYANGEYRPPKPGTYRLWSTCHPSSIIRVLANSFVEITVLSQLPADLTGDGTVNILDISVAAKAFGSRSGDPSWDAMADLDKDGWISIIDISMIAKEYGKTA